ncbi:hypothetical protein TNCT_457451 [Trichonephila clavata]|uniref:Uncharacterized protein n=1 Tax=Trichonephila clavata TaxID=2740835 RepID=A0A8X6GC56_TRICU|nr:hypothetical protein TNCT_457451 [Trichonephila clavata]
MKMGQALREKDDQKTMKAKMWKRRRRKLRKTHIDNQKLGNSAPERRLYMEISVLKGNPFPCIMGPEKDGKKERGDSPPPNLSGKLRRKSLRVKPEPRTGGP